MDSPSIQRALISVSDKTGLVEFGQQLASSGITIYSTGGTAKALKDANIDVIDVSEYTQFPEMMSGRLKTLHPKIFGGILCRHDRQDDMQAIAEHGIHAFELVVVNLYPFEATIAKPGVTLAEVIEQIDIGGPSLVRAAAKNHKFTTIVTSASQYAEVADAISTDKATSLDLRFRLAAAAFARTAEYDTAISAYFQKQLCESADTAFPPTQTISLQLQSVLRYGENPHQQAAIYKDASVQRPSLLNAKQLNGKELSYNNLLDLDAAWSIAKSLPDCAVSVIKHNNPCGAASAATLSAATQKAMDGDPVSAFGSILGMNQEVDAATAEILATPGLFVEAIIAPRFTADALEILKTKPKWKSNVRLMELGDIPSQAGGQLFRQVDGGMLVQDADDGPDLVQEWQCVTQTQPSDELWEELKFAWAMVRHIKSNAIAVTKDRSLVGAGAGQMSRVDSVEISLKKAGERTKGAVLSSDAFFPFPDSIEAAAQAGIAAVIQPGGSKRDQEVIDACNRLGIPMVFTGRRHFKH
ncbi:MAG: bifunctional phosphoribosylaminoimidazolecarboxamide formyltransferase/IMP cyclohydrolase [Pirellulaceae bacterium]